MRCLGDEFHMKAQVFASLGPVGGDHLNHIYVVEDGFLDRIPFSKSLWMPG